MIKISNENELMSILKIISEESVKKSKLIVFEGKDTAQQRYTKELRAGEQMYGVSLSEKEEVDDVGAEDETESEPKDQESDTVEKEEVQPVELESSFENVLKNINTLRAGRSTKDKEIKEELLEYYERLDEEERKILFLFLREISKILQGALDGSDALEPSDAPHYADITFGDEVQSKPEKDSNSVATNQTDEEGEDSFPPIKVNESQNLNEVRKKFKRLLKRF